MNQPVKNPARAFQAGLCACMRVCITHTHTCIHTQYMAYTRIPTIYLARLPSQGRAHATTEREKEGAGPGERTFV